MCLRECFIKRKANRLGRFRFVLICCESLSLKWDTQPGKELLARARSHQRTTMRYSRAIDRERHKRIRDQTEAHRDVTMIATVKRLQLANSSFNRRFQTHLALTHALLPEHSNESPHAVKYLYAVVVSVCGDHPSL